MRHPQTEILFSEEEVQERVKQLAAQVTQDYRGTVPLLICVLRGAVVLLSDFMRYLDLEVEIDFMAVSSYGDSTVTSGIVRILKDLDTSIENRHVILVEDIIDTGLTISYLKEILSSRKPASLSILALLDKPERRKVDIEADYCGYCIPDKFIVGYGLDFKQRYRNLADICVLLEFD